MFCSNCGSKLEGVVKFCPNCGAPVQTAQPAEEKPVKTYEEAPSYQDNSFEETYQEPVREEAYDYQPSYQEEPKADGMAIASLVLGILSIVGLPIIGGILAIVFGTLSINKVGPTGMAKAGRICGIIGLILWIFLIVISVIAATSILSYYSYWY